MADKKFLYKQVYDGVIEELENGRLKPNDKLPTEDAIALQYNVSIITVKKAMSILKTDKIIRRVSGTGTFITEDAMEILHISKGPSSNVLRSYRLLGVILEHVASPFGLDMLYAMDKYAEKYGYKLCIRFSYTNQEKETDEIDYLLSMGVEGLIIMPSHSRHYNTKILKLVVEGFPIVLVDKKLDGVPVPSVYTDNHAGVSLLVKHLYANGHCDIGLLSTPSHGISSIIQRKKAFVTMMKELNLPIYEECVLISDLAPQETFSIKTSPENIDAINDYMIHNKKITALVSTEYGLLREIIATLNVKNLRVPQDISVATFDEDYEKVNECFFTHVKQDEDKIASKAIELIHQIIVGETVPYARSYKIAPIFNEGQTVSKRL